MSTNQQYRNVTADTTPSKEAKEPETKVSKLDLSLTKIVGGALAAMTAAALGSRLSVAGTIVGAALASVIAAVAGALYTASLKHTQDKVRTVWTGRTGDADVPTTIEVTDTHHRPTSTWAPAQPSVPQWDPPGPAPRTQAAEAAELEEHRRRCPGGLRHRRRVPDRLRADLRSRALRWRGHDHHPGQRAEEDPRAEEAGRHSDEERVTDRRAEQHRQRRTRAVRDRQRAAVARAERDDQSADAVRLGHADGEPDSDRDSVGRAQPLSTADDPLGVNGPETGRVISRNT